MNYFETAHVVNRVRELQRRATAVLVAIDGAGGAGKSTLAAQLVDELAGAASVVPMDDFIVRDHMLDESWEHGWDRSRLRAQVLEPVSRGELVVYERFDWERNALGETVELATTPVVIVEGITSMHPALEEFWHLTVWVETAPAVAQERGRARDAGTDNAAHWDLWAANDERYRSEHSPHLRAHVVVHSA